MKYCDDLVPDYDLTAEASKTIKDTAFSLCRRIFYRKKEDGAECVCSICGTRRDLTKTEKRVLQASQTCPTCHRRVKPSTLENYQSREWVIIDDPDTDGLNGFRVRYRWSFDKGIDAEIYRTLYVKGDDEYRRDCVKTLSAMGECTTGGWVKCRRSWYAAYADFYSFPDTARKTRRRYYEDMNINLKSNQVQFVKDYALSREQIGYIYAFDLKSIRDVLKYTGYIKRNPIVYMNPVLNVTYLDYLNRNDIPLADFRDYVAECRTLGFKLDKPKDFRFRHDKYADLVVQKANVVSDELIRNRVKSMTEFKDGDILIRPFHTSAEIIKCGKTLHMCIGTYVKKYATGQTDIYCMTVAGKLEGAIEVCGGALIQARGDRNEDISKNPTIRKWFRGLRKENNERNRSLSQATA